MAVSSAEALHELRGDIDAKYQRYCVPGTDGVNIAGFKFCIRSCPGVDATDAKLADVFQRACGVTDMTKGTRMDKTAFESGLRALAGDMYPGYLAEPDKCLVVFLLNHVAPHRLNEAVFAPLLRSTLPATPSTVMGSPQLLKRASAPVMSPMREAGGKAASTSSPLDRMTGTRAGAAFDRAAAVIASLQNETAARVEKAVSPQSGGRASPAAARTASTAKTLKIPSLSEFLESLRMGSFVAPLADMGVDNVQDLEELTADDLDALGMKQLQARRLKEALVQLRAKLTAEYHAMHSTPAARTGDFTGVDDAPAPREAARRASVASVASSASRASPVPPRTPSPAPASASPPQMSPTDAVRAAATAAAISGMPGTFEWEEHATEDGFLYYHNARTGTTQWLRPASTSIRTIAIRTAEQTAIAAVVEARIAAAIQRKQQAAGADGRNLMAPIDSAMMKQAAAIAAVVAARSPPPAMLDRIIAEVVAADDATDEEQERPSESNEQIDHAPSELVPASERVPWAERSAQRATTWRSAWSQVLQPEDEQQPLQSVHEERDGDEERGYAAPEPQLEARSTRDAAAATQAGSARPNGVSPLRFLDAQAAQLSGDGGGDSGYLRVYLSARDGEGATDGPMIRRNGVTMSTPRGPMSRAQSLTGADSEAASVVTESARRGKYRAAGGDSRARSVTSSRRPEDRADALAELSVVSAVDMYPEVYASMPAMDEKTFDTIVRANMLANPRRMGYADARPDIRPLSMLRPGVNTTYGNMELPPTMSAAGIDVPAGPPGAAGKANSVWASTLRPHLYSPRSDPHAPRSGHDVKRMWAGGGTAPSETASGYAYRHAAATSMYGNAGSVYDRLTDPRGYTGTHRHRFANDGSGLGLAGRENSYDHQYLMNSVETGATAVAAVPPTYALADHHTAGPGKA